MYCSGLIVSVIGVIFVLYGSIPKKHTIIKNSFELKETIQSRDFETPVNSKLKVKLNGTLYSKWSKTARLTTYNEKTEG